MSKSKRDKQHLELLKAAGWTSERARQWAENEKLIPILPPPPGYVVKKGRKPKSIDVSAKQELERREFLRYKLEKHNAKKQEISE